MNAQNRVIVMRQFIAVILDDPDRGFGVVFPDMPGCVASAATFEEASDAAAEALAVHLDEMERDGLAIPQPSSFTSVLARPQYRDGVAIRVHASKISTWRRAACETLEP
ncbi:type II toxin-antitoxin system HicB family antitoxin [Methylocapsa sp. S129]|uniref:type II toxin-antitoxin system HicB family antitoxin n=1 Tax=Methylocapsa sp. S129 TaxID=1641869 RepID=UPI00131A7B5B|nr:type II toxin-antitoxin system HicB family antitoxin [Methylocapsa sp. S129]